MALPADGAGAPDVEVAVPAASLVTTGASADVEGDEVDGADGFGSVGVGSFGFATDVGAGGVTGGVGTGTGGGLGTVMVGTVGVGSAGVETVGVGTETVGTETDVGTVSAGLEWGRIKRVSNAAAKIPARAASTTPGVQVSARPVSRLRTPLQPPVISRRYIPILHKSESR